MQTSETSGTNSRARPATTSRDEPARIDDDDLWPDSIPSRPRDPARRLILVALSLFVLCAALGAGNLLRATTFSALDEATHLDYAWKTVHGSVPFDGDRLARYTLDTWACQGQANIPKLPACGSNAPASAFPALGLNYNGIHPPLYYFLTGLGAEAIGAISGASFYTAARMMGILWVFLGLSAFYLVLRYWRVRWQYALAWSALLVTIPSELGTLATVTNDAPTLLAGAAALFVLGRMLIYRRTSWILPAALTVLIASTKIISVAAMAAVALVMLGWAVTEMRRRTFKVVRPVIVTAVMMGVATGLVYLGWTLIQNRLAVPGYVNPVGGISTRLLSHPRLPLVDWFGTVVNGFGLGTDYYLDPPVDNSVIRGWSLAVALMFSAIGFVALVRLTRRNAVWWAALAFTVGCFLYPLIVQVQTYVSSSGTKYFPNPSTRYGITLMPLGVALVAMLASGYRARRMSAAAVAFGLLVVITGTFGLT